MYQLSYAAPNNCVSVIVLDEDKKGSQHAEMKVILFASQLSLPVSW